MHVFHEGSPFSWKTQTLWKLHEPFLWKNIYVQQIHLIEMTTYTLSRGLEGKGWKSCRLMLAFYCIFFWERLPLMNSCGKLPTIHSDNNRQKRSRNVTVSTESPNSDDIRNASKNANTKDIKKVFLLGDCMVKHVQGWHITKRIGNKRKVYVRQFSECKVDCMKDYMKPCMRENNPDHLIFHDGTNDVPSNKKSKFIAE